MNSRERIELALHHREPDHVPLDLGSSPVSSMHVSMVYKLRQALGLDPPGTPVRVTEPYQMLGEIKSDLLDAVGADVVGLTGRKTAFGFLNDDWKPWSMFDGTPVLVPSGFNTDPEPDGSILMYPEGDKSVLPSGRMPKDGWYFDAIMRQLPVDDHSLNVEDNLEEFQLVTDEEVDFFRQEAERLYSETDQAILGHFGGISFGDVSMVPAPWLRQPLKGIRDVEEWYISIITRPDYIYEVFERQCEVALSNLAKIHAAVEDRVSIVYISGTDFGMQQGLLISPKTYRGLFKPFHRRVNDWVHTHTNWKTFMHSCGSIFHLIGDFIEAGFDILNPIQSSAAHMDPCELKRRFGDRVVFWGGGVDTQRTLPTGTPQEVRAQVLERIKVLGPGGGFVFNTIHNVQPLTPVDNLLVMYETVREYGHYPVV